MAGHIATTSCSRHRIKGHTASVARFFLISNAFMITWVLITSELGYYSKLFGPQVLLQLNIAFYLPSIPVLIISGQLEKALQARFGPTGSMMLRLNFGLGGCLACCAAFPFLPQTLNVLMTIVVILGTLSAVAFSTAYQLVSNFRAADCISLGIGGAGSGPIVLLIQLLLGVGPRPAHWQWIAMFEVAATMVLLGLLSSLSLFTQYWSILSAAPVPPGAVDSAKREDRSLQDPLLPPSADYVTAESLPRRVGSGGLGNVKAVPVKRTASGLAGTSVGKTGSALSRLTSQLLWGSGGGDGAWVGHYGLGNGDESDEEAGTLELLAVQQGQLPFVVGCEHFQGMPSRLSQGFDTVSDAWGTRSVPILTRARTSLGHSSRPSPTSGFLGFTPPRALLLPIHQPSVRDSELTLDTNPLSPGTLARNVQRRSTTQSWFGSGGHKAQRQAPEQHYVSTMGFDQLAQQQQQQQQYSHHQAQQQQRPAQQQQQQPRLDISTRSAGLPPRTPSARTSRELFAEPKVSSSPHRSSNVSSAVPDALRLDSFGGSSRDSSVDSSGGGGAVGLVSYTPAPMLSWTSPFSSQAQLAHPDSPHNLLSPPTASPESHDLNSTDLRPTNLHHSSSPKGVACAAALQHAGHGGDGVLTLEAGDLKDVEESQVDDTPLTLGEETYLVIQGTWQILLGFFSSVSLLYLVFPFFTYLPSSGLLGESLPRVLFFVRIFADLLGRFLPRKKMFMTSSPSIILSLAVVQVTAVALFFGYLRAPSQMHHDLLSVGIVAFIWLQGGYINTTSNLLAPNLVHPLLCGRASAMMALTFQVAHFAGLLLAALLTFLLYGDLLNH